MSANHTEVARVRTSRGAKQHRARSTFRPTLERLEDRLAPAAVVRATTGADTAALQATVDQFRADLGAPNNANTAGPLATGRREINWDGGGTNTTIGANPFNGFQLIRG